MESNEVKQLRNAMHKAQWELLLGDTFSRLNERYNNKLNFYSNRVMRGSETILTLNYAYGWRIRTRLRGLNGNFAVNRIERILLEWLDEL